MIWTSYWMPLGAGAVFLALLMILAFLFFGPGSERPSDYGPSAIHIREGSPAGAQVNPLVATIVVLCVLFFVAAGVMVSYHIMTAPPVLGDPID